MTSLNLTMLCLFLVISNLNHTCYSIFQCSILQAFIFTSQTSPGENANSNTSTISPKYVHLRYAYFPNFLFLCDTSSLNPQSENLSIDIYHPLSLFPISNKVPLLSILRFISF